MTTKIMKSSVMNFHDFAGCNLIFTMTTGKHLHITNVVHRLVCLDIIATSVIYFYIMYFPRDLVKIGFFTPKLDKFGSRIFIVVQEWEW